MKNTLKLLATMIFLGSAGPTLADTIVCPDSAGAFAQSTSAEECKVGVPGNPDADDILAFYPGDPWSDVGHIDDGTTLAEGFLSIVISAGNFGENFVEIVWTIADSFWETYGEAVISIHVGNGNNDEPDHYAWLITPGATTGTITYEGPTGWSNIVLWARGEGRVSVPEPGTLALLGGGLLLLGLRRRVRRQA